MRNHALRRQDEAVEASRSPASAARVPTSQGPQITPAVEEGGDRCYEGHDSGLTSQGADCRYPKSTARSLPPYRPQVVALEARLCQR